MERISFDLPSSPICSFPTHPLMHNLEGGHDNETAGDFFKRVQETTDTLILWPSRLKIGAKSKKGQTRTATQSSIEA